jgi:hypothetical protein
MPEQGIHNIDLTDATAYGDLFALQRGPDQSFDYKTNSIGLVGVKLTTIEVTYTLAQLASGQTLVAAPGSGLIIFPMDNWCRYNAGSTGAALDYTIAISGYDIATSILSAKFRLDAGTTAALLGHPNTGANNVNAAVVVNSASSFGAANGTFTVWLAYTTIPV